MSSGLALATGTFCGGEPGGEGGQRRGVGTLMGSHSPGDDLPGSPQLVQTIATASHSRRYRDCPAPGPTCFK